jgi:hypothetical protein
METKRIQGGNMVLDFPDPATRGADTAIVENGFPGAES